MFYYRNWERFCQWVAASGIPTYTAEQSLQAVATSRFIVLKHDVETSVDKAHRLACIEHRYGLCGSYYVQAYLLNDEHSVGLLQEMQRWGHEISYHYDVLDAHAGNYQEADVEFRQNLQRFARHGFHFSTICQHGNPIRNRVGYTSNRDFFRNEDIRSRYPRLVDMVVNYSRHIQRPYLYISDVGYRWNLITEPETTDLHPQVPNTVIGNFSSLKAQIETSACCFVISTHPHRWTENAARIYLRIAVFRLIRPAVLTLKRIPFVAHLLNRYYYLAKKI